MRKTHTRIVGAVAALLAAALAGFSLRSQPKSVSLAARSPAPAVATQVIRRTIHIVRHEHPRSAGTSRPGALAQGGRGPRGSARSIHTGASGSRGAGAPGGAVSAGGAAVTTRTSPSHASTSSAPSGSAPTGAPVTTRTSPGHATTGSTPSGSAPTGARPTTRTSPHGAGGSTSSGRPVATRSSGGRHGEDGGGDHGD
jgi:hypothetical protein